MRIPSPNYTQTPNDLFDKWLPLLGEAELKVLLVIIRKTFGWHKPSDAISISQLSKITGMLEETVIKAARSLQKKGVITRKVVGLNGKQETIYELIVTEESNNNYPSDKPSPPPLGLDRGVQTEAQKKALSSKEKQQQGTSLPSKKIEQNAAAFFKEEPKKEKAQRQSVPPIQVDPPDKVNQSEFIKKFEMMKDLPLSFEEKSKFSRSYSEIEIEHAISFYNAKRTVSPTYVPTKGWCAFLRTAIKEKWPIPLAHEEKEMDNKKFAEMLQENCQPSQIATYEVLNKNIEIFLIGSSKCYTIAYNESGFKKRLCELLSKFFKLK